MPVIYDQMNRAVEAPFLPQRIISIVPSQTELLFDLGLNDEIIGITKFCVHPADKVKRKQKVGGTKTVNINLVKKLNPDLIIGNKEENEQEQIEELMKHFPVWMSDIHDLAGALDMIAKLGEITGKSEKAIELASGIRAEFDNLRPPSKGLKVAYFIWRKPYMVAGKGTFIDDMLSKCGLINAFEKERYPEVMNQELITADPDVVLLSSEPYPFRERHFGEFKLLLPGADVKLVDGELFSWYGSRLLQAPEYFEKLLNELPSV
jgi:ABC-type Fe3+-hydroxamate transport system substrate-binding protein